MKIYALNQRKHGIKLLFTFYFLLCVLPLTGCILTPKYSPLLLSNIQNDLTVCDQQPSSAVCNQAIHELLRYSAQRKPQKNGADISAKKVLEVIYNGKQAKALFLTRIPNIDGRANFFATNNVYFENTNMPVRWFGASEHISRRCIFGLGAKGCGSSITFALAKNVTNPNLYAWRNAVGDKILQQGFSDFKALFNDATAQPFTSLDQKNSDIMNARAWDINQLTKEQSMAQPLHNQYLANDSAFLILSKSLTGINLLDEKSRLKFGYKLLKHRPLEQDRNLSNVSKIQKFESIDR